MDVVDREIDEVIDRIKQAISPNEHAGVCNYTITRILDAVYEENRYSKINAAIGVLECAKLEFYRRRAADYEDGKIRANGDAYIQRGQ